MLVRIQHADIVMVRAQSSKYTDKSIYLINCGCPVESDLDLLAKIVWDKT